MSDADTDPHSMLPERRDGEMPQVQKVRTAQDADDDDRLLRDPANEDAKLDVALDESFPTSDPPANTQPGKGKDPPPSSGYDEAEEAAKAAMAGKE
jgi:hypothetical protein